MSLRRVLVAVGALLVLGTGVVLVPVSPAEGAAGQYLLFDHRAAHVKNAYWQPPVVQPANYVAPANFRDGRVLMRLEIGSKPSAKPLQAALCFWRHGAAKFQWETCAPSRRAAFSTPGVSYVDFGPPAGWWKKNGVYDWARQASIIRIIAATNRNGATSGRVMWRNTCQSDAPSICALSSSAGSTCARPRCPTACPATAACYGGSRWWRTRRSNASCAATPIRC